MTRTPRRHAGQALTEMVLIIAFVAILAIPAISFLRDITAAAYVAHQTALSMPLASPSPTP